MATVITVLIIIVCVLLILIVLIQNSKGGGLASNFSSSNQVMGVRKTADVLEKATWTLAGALLVLCLMSAPYNRSTEEVAAPTESVTKKRASEEVIPSAPQNTNIPSAKDTNRK